MGNISESLALVVRKETTGELDTNIADIEAFVTERIKDYSPDAYMGDADMAKKDRAELNKAKKSLGDARKSVIDRLMQPYKDFEARCKSLEKLIDTASGKLDVIVKTRENEEKEAKRKLIQIEWDSRNFDLVSLEKVFDPRWLNKSFKMTDIVNEMTVIIKQIYENLKTIETAFPEDSEMIKAHYLVTLNVSEALSYGRELADKKEKQKKELEERAEREHNDRIIQQKKELAQEQKDVNAKSNLAGLVADAAGDESPEPECGEYTFTVSVTDTQLMGIKNYLNMQGIEFECNKLEF